MSNKPNYGGLDRFRVAAALLIIAIHVSPLAAVSEEADFFLTRVLARIAVPFFFMVTGQFTAGAFLEDPGKGFPVFKRFLKKTALLYGFCILLYLPVGIYAGHYGGLTFGGMLRMLLFDGTFYHLWYFPAVMAGMVLIYLMSLRCGPKIMTAVSGILYVIGLFGDSYFGLTEKAPALNAAYEFGFRFWSYTRNGLFFAPLFLMLGMWMGKRGSARKETEGDGSRPPVKFYYAGLALSFAVMTGEAFTLRHFGLQRHDSMYFALIPMAVFLYLCLMSTEKESVAEFRVASTWIYILHPMLIVAVRGAAKLLHLEKYLIDNNAIHYLVVVQMSVAAGLLAVYFRVKYMPRLLAYLNARPQAKALKAKNAAAENTEPKEKEAMAETKSAAEAGKDGISDETGVDGQVKETYAGSAATAGADTVNEGDIPGAESAAVSESGETEGEAANAAGDEVSAMPAGIQASSGKVLAASAESGSRKKKKRNKKKRKSREMQENPEITERQEEEKEDAAAPGEADEDMAELNRTDENFSELQETDDDDFSDLRESDDDLPDMTEEIFEDFAPDEPEPEEEAPELQETENTGGGDELPEPEIRKPIDLKKITLRNLSVPLGARPGKPGVRQTAERSAYAVRKPKDREGYGVRGDFRAWIELDSAALEHNVNFLRSRLTGGCRLMPAVKADAYGHGAVLIARQLNRLNVNAFCVACLSEGVALRKAGVKGRILILGYTSPGDFPLLVRYLLTQTVIDYHYAQTLNGFGKPLHVHVGIDTGMHRTGIRCENIEEIVAVHRMKNLQVDGMFTHLSVSDSLRPEDRAFTDSQVKAFYGVADILRDQGFPCKGLHLLASYGILNLLPDREKPRKHTRRNPEEHGLINTEELAADYVRPGIALYGTLSTEVDSNLWRSSLRPVLSLKSKVVSVRKLYTGEAAGYGTAFTATHDMQIATISIGYADGLPRELSYGIGTVLINGCEAPVIGRICMDQTIVDVSNIPRVQPGNTAVIIGKSGAREITADHLAEQCGTITNEILSRLGSRLNRIMV